MDEVALNDCNPQVALQLSPLPRTLDFKYDQLETYIDRTEIRVQDGECMLQINKLNSFMVRSQQKLNIAYAGQRLR